MDRVPGGRTATAPRGKRRGYLGPQHRLAEAAKRRCRDLHGRHGQVGVGGVACGRCWEYAIRADERLLVQFGLDNEGLDEVFIDELAVDRALRGQRVRLTETERLEVIRRLRDQGATSAEMAALLHMTPRNVVRLKARLRAAEEAAREVAERAAHEDVARDAAMDAASVATGVVAAGRAA